MRETETLRADEIERRREALLTELERLQERSAALERFGEDDFEEGAVLTFSTVFPGSETRYSYAAVKADGLWYVTARDQRGHSWEWLVDVHLSRSDDAAYVDEVVDL